MTYDPTNRGALFKADKKGNPKRPDYNGTLNVEGKDYEIAGWISESKEKKLVYVQLKVQPKRNAKQEPAALPQSAPAERPETTQEVFGDSEIPF